MTYLILLLLLVMVGGLIYLGRLPGAYLVRRSLSMNVERQRVFDKVRDMASWKEWSPWLLHEPATRLAFSDDVDQEGGFYTWDGRLVGAGKLTHVRFTGVERIEQRIEFTRPFKAVSKVWWEFAEDGGQTEVTWCMQGRMPFVLRFMTDMTRSMIEKDYDLGLAMLRGVLDPDAERPVIEFAGEVQREAQTALTLPFKGGLQDMVKAMQAGFPKLNAYAEQTGIVPAGPLFAAYYKVDPKAMYFEGDMALPVRGDVDAGEFTRRTIADGRCFKVSLQGSYDFLELAWYSAMCHLRMRKLKLDKRRPTLEVYENDPQAVAHSNQILTSLYLPLK